MGKRHLFIREQELSVMLFKVIIGATQDAAAENTVYVY